MNINKSDRTALKSYFAKNAVPTAGNFAELLDGMINQKEDGIAKIAGEPLSVQAEGDGAGQQKAINFYKSFADAKPAWTLSLNPRTDPNNPATAKAGLSFADANGISRLFIDQATGNVGIGTTAPTHKLHLVAADAVGLLESTGTQAYLRLSTSEGFDNRVELANRPGGRLALWTTGGGDQFNITRDGKVGIGMTDPLGKLEVVGAVAISNGTRMAIGSYMASGSLTLGSTVASYGGGQQWHPNVAALLFETQANTEIAVHDSHTRIASLMYYEGDAANRITIGRDMGWGPIGQVVVNGSIKNPMWNVTQVFSSKQGALPLTSSAFTTGGGSLLIIASGSGWGAAAMNIGMTIQLDGAGIGEARTFTNEGGSHKSFTCNPVVKRNVAAGSHTITLTALAGTASDGNDWFNVTVLEFPF